MNGARGRTRGRTVRLRPLRRGGGEGANLSRGDLGANCRGEPERHRRSARSTPRKCRDGRGSSAWLLKFLDSRSEIVFEIAQNEPRVSITAGPKLLARSNHTSE